MSLDLYGTSANAVAQGNARNSAVRDLNERIRQHNTDVANKISGLKDQVKNTQQLKDLQQTGQALWTGKGMPDKVKAFNDYYADKKASNPTTQSETTTRSAAQENPAPESDAQTPADTDVEAPAESSAVTETEEVSGATGEGGEVGAEGSDLAGGLEGAVGKGSKIAGKFGEGAGVLMSAGAGAMDLYEDYEDSKRDGHFEIAGNNAWEKAGNILQIGGAIADVAGVFFPPAKLLGGVLDLASAGTDEIGEKLDDKPDRDLDAEQQQETEGQLSIPAGQTLTTGRTQ
jgi:TolA-binding protein